MSKIFNYNFQYSAAALAITFFLVISFAQANKVPYLRLADFEDAAQIDAGETVTIEHNLGGDPADYIVDLTVQPDGAQHTWSYMSNQGVGGDRWFHYPSNRVYQSGAAWHNLTSNQISVTRYGADEDVNVYRVRIWKACKPDYDSQWITEAGGSSLFLNHNLGGDPGKYVVYLTFEDTAASNNKGYHNIGMGGDESPDQFMTEYYGAYWHNLDDTKIYFTRMADDERVDRARIRIWKNQETDADSQWFGFPPVRVDWVYFSSSHLSDCVVVMDRMIGGSSNPLWNSNKGVGGDRLSSDGGVYEAMGTYWSALSLDSCRAYIGSKDDINYSYRVRIFKCTQPRFDTGWTTIAKGEQQTHVHDIGRPTNEYWVDLQIRTNSTLPTRGVNNSGVGGDTWEDYGVVKARGIAWHNLTEEEIKVTRAPDDIGVDEYRLRMWLTAPPLDTSMDYPMNPGDLHSFEMIGNSDIDQVLVQILTTDTSPSGYGIHNFTHGGDSYFDGGDLKYAGMYFRGPEYDHPNFKFDMKRNLDDVYSDQIRLQYWSTKAADQTMDEDFFKPFANTSSLTSLPLSHLIGRNPNTYVVDLKFRNELNREHNIGANGDFLMTSVNGLNAMGVCWHQLNDKTINIWQGAGNTESAQTSIRIWSVGPVGAADIRDHALGRYKLTYGQRLIKEADFNKDGNVNVADIIQAINSGYK